MKKAEYLQLVQELPEEVFEEYFDKYMKRQIEQAFSKKLSVEQSKKYVEDNKQYFDLLKKEDVIVKVYTSTIELFLDLEELVD